MTKEEKKKIAWQLATHSVVDGNVIGRAVTPHPDAIAQVIAGAYTFVCCANDIAESAVVDATAAIREAGLYRQEIKHLCKRVAKSFEVYHAAMRRAMYSEQRMQLWMLLADKYCDEMQPHVNNLYFQVWQSLLNVGEQGPKAQVMARVLTASALMTLATQNYDDYFTVNARKTGADLRCLFLGGDLTPIAKLWRGVSEIVFRGDVGKTELNDAAVLAIKVLRRQLVSYDRMERLTDEVLAEHPELKAQVERENNKKL